MEVKGRQHTLESMCAGIIVENVSTYSTFFDSQWQEFSKTTKIELGYDRMMKKSPSIGGSQAIPEIFMLNKYACLAEQPARQSYDLTLPQGGAGTATIYCFSLCRRPTPARNKFLPSGSDIRPALTARHSPRHAWRPPARGHLPPPQRGRTAGKSPAASRWPGCRGRGCCQT